VTQSNGKAIWKARKAPDSSLEPFVLEFGKLLGPVLWARGFATPNDDELTSFLDPKLQDIQSPLLMLNMKESIDRIVTAIQKNEKICIYSDYDMDGIAGLSLLYSFFKACNVSNVTHFQPHRFDDGYGLHGTALEKLYNDGARLVITVDTGTTAIEAIAHANTLGLDVIITDHHAQKETLPETPWLINPNQKTDTSDLGYLSGTGVAFYLCMALRQALREKNHFKDFPEPDLREWLDIFCLGTVGDVVDLRGDNRALIRTGLQYMAKTKRPGLSALLESTLAADQINRINTRDLAFSVIPKLNAASRMGKAELSTQLLLTSFRDQAESLVSEILELNSQRSATQDKIFEEANFMASKQNEAGDHVIVVHGPWHEGVLGIVAAKLVENYACPAIVLGENHEGEFPVLRGSMRTPAPYSSLELLSGAKESLIQFGGHQAAAGMQLKLSEFSNFHTALNKTFADKYIGQTEDLYVEQAYDAELGGPGEVSVQDVTSLSKAEPYGAGNPEPTFLLRNYPVENFTLLKEKHLKAKKSFGSPELIGFNLATSLHKLKADGVKALDLLVVPELNIFRNQARPQLRIQHLRAAEAQL